MDPKITEEIKKQEDALDQSIALNKITVMLLDERKKELKKVWVFFFVVCVAFVALFSVFAYTTHKEKQELLTQLNDTRVDFMEYLDSIEYTVTDDYSTDSHTETTQTVGKASARVLSLSKAPSKLTTNSVVQKKLNSLVAKLCKTKDGINSRPYFL